MVIDKLMPTLKDSELRILLVLLRSTVGWNREGLPVRLTYRMLQARSGRASEAVARALQSLEKQGFIHISHPKTEEFIRKAKELDAKSEVHI